LIRALDLVDESRLVHERRIHDRVLGAHAGEQLRRQLREQCARRTVLLALECGVNVTEGRMDLHVLLRE